jgi:hypothetical protein
MGEVLIFAERSSGYVCVAVPPYGKVLAEGADYN